MKLELMERRQRGSYLFPFQHYRMTNPEGNLFVPYHWHSEIEIVYMVRGKGKLLLDGYEHALETDNIYFINREFLHQFSGDDCELVYYAYVFPLEYLDFKIEDYSQATTISPLVNTKVFPFRISPSTPCYHEIKKEIQELFDLNETKPIGYQLQSKACLYKIISILQREDLLVEVDSQSQNNSRSIKTTDIKKLLTYLQSEYKNPLTLQEAAAILNYSPVYFCTFFKSAFGINFTHYLNHFRVEKACILLSSSSLSIMEIGFEVGFRNFSYFIRTFKSRMKMTPRQYRSQNRNKPYPIKSVFNDTE